MSTMLQDFRYALRALRKNSSLSAVVVLSLAVGIGANTAIFSVVDALLLRPLPYPQPEKLANIWLHTPALKIFRDWPSPGEYLDLQNENHSFEEMAIAQLNKVTLTGLDQPERIDVMETSSSLLHMLGAKPLLGRLLLAEEDKPGQPSVVILSHRLWTRAFAADPRIVGKIVTLAGVPHTVAGVLKPAFQVSAETMPAEMKFGTADAFLPFPIDPGRPNLRDDENYNVLVRLKPGVTLKQAQANVDVIAGRIREKDHRDRTFGMSIVGLEEQVVGDVRRPLLVMLGSVTLVLLVACANVANLLLARADARRKEIAIRAALGAGGARIVRQLLTESLLLAILGGAAGLAVAQAALYLVRTVNPGNIPRLDEIGIDGAVLAFTFAISLATGIAFGIAPALQSRKLDLITALNSSGRAPDDGGLGLRRNWLRGLLVISELALSLILLTGAGLLVRSFVRLEGVPPGFATDNILSMKVAVNGPQKREDIAAAAKALARFHREIGERIGHLPSVTSQGLISALPLTGTVGWGQINVEGYSPPPGEEFQTDFRAVTPGYFSSMSIPLVKGRFFTDRDMTGSQQVAIVDQTFAARFWPNGDAIGKHLWDAVPEKSMTIVGVVGAVRQDGLAIQGKPAMYIATSPDEWDDMYLVVRASSDPAGLANAIVREIRLVDSNAVVYDVRTMQDRLRDSLARQRFSAVVLGAFASVAVLLAAIGVYGVMSYLVSRSTHAIGVRIALGAQAPDILGMVIRHGMELVAIGIAVGSIGALTLTRSMASLLFGITPTDAITFSSVALILTAAALAATLIPALRAMRVNPMVALREE